MVVVNYTNPDIVIYFFATTCAYTAFTRTVNAARQGSQFATTLQGQWNFFRTISCSSNGNLFNVSTIPETTAWNSDSGGVFPKK